MTVTGSGQYRKEAETYLLFGIFLVSTAAFYLLKPIALQGGDSIELGMRIESQWFWYYFRAPLTFFLHQVAYRILSPFYMNGHEVIAVLSCIAGGLYVVALYQISRHPVFLVVTLLSPYIFIFVSHVEHYAWVSMSLTWFILGIKRYVEGRWTLVPATVFYILSMLFHPLALFYFPALLYVCTRIGWHDGRLRVTKDPGISPSHVRAMLLMFVITLLAATSIQLIFREFVCGLGVDKRRLCPLFSNPDPEHYYFTLFSLEHIAMYTYFISMSSPLGVPVVLIALPYVIKKRFYRFLLVMTVCGGTWTFLWHPDMHLADWDLIGNFAVPTNILAGLVLRDFALRMAQKRIPFLQTFQRANPS